MSASEAKKIIGIDISKQTLDVYQLSDNQYRSFKNTADGINQLILFAKNCDLLVMEPTGGYEQLCLQMLQKHQLPVALVNARQIRNFARATGKLAKTDKLDAKVLAIYGHVLKPAPTPVRSEHQVTLSAKVERRRQLVDMMADEKRRRESTRDPVMLTLIAEHIAFLKAQVIALDKAIIICIKRCPLMEKKHLLLQEVKAIGPVTAAVLIAELPELGMIEHKKISSLAGLAPMNRDSGAMRGKRHIRGGRRHVRCTLYMATIAAIRFNPKIGDFYRHLRAQHKHAKVAIVAAMRKFLILLNAIMKNFYTHTDNLLLDNRGDSIVQTV